MSELKPCPFCGAVEPVLTTDGRWWDVHCSNAECVASVGAITGPDAAKTMWNHYVLTPEPKEDQS